MWYRTEEEAQKACREKEKQYGCAFFVLKEDLLESDKLREIINQDYIYWAQRGL